MSYNLKLSSGMFHIPKEFAMTHFMLKGADLKSKTAYDLNF